ncbi:Permease of the major facilitator superfamily [Candidatus Burkholderia humilis]|nr:Permease of the major facilitator superfamily [Candidatus Burkholderia humilis]
MISESTPPEKRGYYAAWSQLGVGGGFVLSSAAFLAVQALPHEQFISWGWRLPFLASILIFALSVYIRHNLPESRDFENADKAGKTSHMPVVEVIKRHPKEILMAMGLRVAENGGAYIFLAFSLVYGKFAGIPNSTMLTGVMLAMIVEMIAMLLWGKLSDRIGRKPVHDRRDLARTHGVPLLLAARYAFHAAHLARAGARHGRLSRRDDRHAARARRRTVQHRSALFGRGDGARSGIDLRRQIVAAHRHGLALALSRLLVGGRVSHHAQSRYRRDAEVYARNPSALNIPYLKAFSRGLCRAYAHVYPYRRQGMKPSAKRYNYEWYVVICMLAYVFSFIDRQVLALMIEPIKRDLHLSDTQFSLLHGFAFSLFYAVMGMLLAYLSDRFARPRIIATGIALWSMATAACGMSQSFVHMFISRMSVGVGEAALSPGTYSMFADMLPKSKLGRAVGVYSLGSFIGGGIAFLVGGYVIALPFIGDVRAWQITFFIVGLPGLLIALLFALTVRNPARKGFAQDGAGRIKRVSMVDSLNFVGAHRKTFFCHYIGFSFYAMTLYCLMGWSPAFYMRHFGLSPVDAGYTLGTVMLVANTAGVFCGGWLSDWLLRRGHTDAPMRTACIGAACMFVPAVMFAQTASLNASLAWLVAAMFFASFPLATSAAAMQTLAPNQMRAQISALFLLVSNLIGLGLGTTLVALVTDKVFGLPLAIGHSMTIVNAIATAFAAVLLFIGCRHFRASLAREASHAEAMPTTASSISPIDASKAF